MADISIGSMGKIFQVALKIKKAVGTVKHNEKECQDIQRFVARVTSILRKLDETTDTMKDEVMRDALEDLAVSLERALELVIKCQRKHILRRFFGAGDMARELDRVQNDILRKLQLGNFATSVQATVVLTNIQSTGPPPHHPPSRQVIIDGFTQFSFSELKTATEDFSDRNIIARGGSATVYKGVLHDGQVVAIKDLQEYIELHDERTTYDEINIFLKLKHKNIITPLGYCHEIAVVMVSHEGKYAGAQHNRFYFVKEYMPNGSMENIISGSRRIDWSSSSRIIRGIAQGVHHLHEQHSIVHMDLKPANILLDSAMDPRISDFGLATCLDQYGDDKITHLNTIRGTAIYMAPEYIVEGVMTPKCDVYAFGLTLLGIISGMSISGHHGVGALAPWAWEARDRDAARMEELFDPSLCHKSHLTDIKRCMDIGLLCIQYRWADRPTMLDVLAMLSGEKELPALKQPSY